MGVRILRVFVTVQSFIVACGRRPFAETLLIFVSINLFLSSSVWADDAVLRERLRHRVEFSRIDERLGVADTSLHALEAIQRFYVERFFTPAWIESDGISRQARELLQVLSRAHEHGLRPDDYHVSTIRAYLNRENSVHDDERIGLAADLELLLTDAMLMYMTHMLAGRVNPRTIDSEWFADMRGAAIVAMAQ
ncbi:MAG: hypothetical protein HUJ31_12135 [Pseudomonadales bacterium]|nr:hypothetical protein [Pseudomonadales bacterium]